MAVDLLESKVPLGLEAVERGKKQPGPTASVSS